MWPDVDAGGQAVDMPPEADMGAPTTRGAERIAGTMEGPDSRRLAAMLRTLRALDDHELCALVAHAQGLLLDRPAGGNNALAVEIVDGQEGRLLAVYRRLSCAAQHRVLTDAHRLVHAQGAPQEAHQERARSLTVSGGQVGPYLQHGGRDQVRPQHQCLCGPGAAGLAQPERAGSGTGTLARTAEGTRR